MMIQHTGVACGASETILRDSLQSSVNGQLADGEMLYCANHSKVERKKLEARDSFEQEDGAAEEEEEEESPSPPPAAQHKQLAADKKTRKARRKN